MFYRDGKWIGAEGAIARSENVCWILEEVAEKYAQKAQDVFASEHGPAIREEVGKRARIIMSMSSGPERYEYLRAIGVRLEVYRALAIPEDETECAAFAFALVKEHISNPPTTN
ncbi:hypothetical protein HY970_00485 [Candidatus Kaiserbacteria bacterium]|nr:hypothetical protein [Candidatus Kaiserbacteria bacterium]